jgi:transcriptional regulator with XRE-family HTH domain
MKKSALSITSAKGKPLSQQIKEARQVEGLTQAELAVLMGTCQSVIAKWESAKYGRCSLRSLAKLGVVLGREIDIQLIPREKDKA